MYCLFYLDIVIFARVALLTKRAKVESLYKLYKTPLEVR